MTQISEEMVLAALARVQDPDLNRDIVSLGFVKNLEIDGDAVRFDVELTTPACPVKDKLKNQCLEEVRALGATHVEVNMTARVRSAPVTGRQKIPGVRNVIAIASGKGGVGKSTVCINLAISLARSGARVGVLDADFYGPSVPTLVGLHERIAADPQNRLIPHEAYGIKLISMGFLVDRNQAVSWRGPMLHKMLGNFLYGALWGELDYLLLDLPPGTGDVQLSLMQGTPLSGAVLVTTPQEVALRDVEKGLQMFRSDKNPLPVFGIIENMSYYLCGSCSKKHRIFGTGGAERMAETFKIPLLGQIPLDAGVPSELGRGEPLMMRDPESPTARAFAEVAGQVVAEVSKVGSEWAVPGPGAMEV